MLRLVEFPLKDGGCILVEVDDPVSDGGIVPAASLGETVAKATQSFEDALKKVKVTAAGLLSELRGLAEAPEEISVEFGIKIGAEAGVILASGTVEANYKIGLKWKAS